MFDHILVDLVGSVGRITLNRPEVLNAISPKTFDEIKTAIAGLTDDPQVRSILLIGKGASFSSGGDLKFLTDMTDASSVEIKENVYKYFAGGIKAVKLCPKPVVAAVRGHAVATGCELALACDFRIASETALFAETWVKLGITIPLGGLFLLPRIIGLTRATEMVMTGRRVKADEAERIGLVNRVVPDDKLEEEAMALAQELAAGPPLALAAIKDGLRRGMEGRLTDEMDFSMFNQAVLIAAADYKEGLASVKERRKANFTGR